MSPAEHSGGGVASRYVVQAVCSDDCETRICVIFIFLNNISITFFIIFLVIMTVLNI